MTNLQVIPSSLETLGLPVNLDAERFVLGSIMLDPTHFPDVARQIAAEDFSLEKHRRIFRRMAEIQERGARIDRVTVAEELMRQNQLESVDGVTYLCSLDDGMPRLQNITSYVGILRDKAKLRRVIMACSRAINEALRHTGAAEEVAQSIVSEMLGEATYQDESRLLTLMEVIQRRGGMDGLFPKAGTGRGVMTGFTRYDEMTGGLLPGELTILAARPSMGKSALAGDIAMNAAFDHGKRSAIFSLEMSDGSLLQRMICSRARVDLQKALRGYAGPDERKRMNIAASELMDAPITIDDWGSSSMLDAHSKLRRLAAEGKAADLAIFDHLQLIQSTDRKEAENRNLQLDGITRYGKNVIAKEMDIPVLMLCQLSRASETRQDHRPILSDLRESGAIEQHADVVSVVFREEYYKPDYEEFKGLAELIVRKQRNGPLGTVNLVFLKEFTKFENQLEGRR